MFSRNKKKSSEDIQQEELNRSLNHYIRAMVAGKYPVSYADDDLLCVAHGDFLLEMEFEDCLGMPYMFLCVNQSYERPLCLRKQLELNRMNLCNMAGQHVLDNDIGLYKYRLAYPMDGRIDPQTLEDILNYCFSEAGKGFNRLTTC